MKTGNLISKFIFVSFVGMVAISRLAFTDESSELIFKIYAHPMEAMDIFQKYLLDDPVIIDAGAFDGKEGAIMAKRWPLGQVHSFEPIPEIFTKLAQTASKVDNMNIYNFALGNQNGYFELYLSELTNEPGVPSASASLRQPKEHLDYAPHVIFPRTITVETLTIDTWAELNAIDHVDMMWLDMQGVELEVLKASPKILATTYVIMTEVEFIEAYEGQYLYQDIKNWLEKQGFKLVWCNFNPSCPTQNGQWFGDALFVRK